MIGLKCNKLSLNVNKSSYMLVTNTKVNNGVYYSLHVGSETLNRQTHAKFLGVFVDQQLKCHSNINYCRTKIIKCAICYK